MEHYLGEKLKKLRESRGWTQADLAKRLNKAVSTISGYESDAHAIPLDVLASISSLYRSDDTMVDKFSQVAGNVPVTNNDPNRRYTVINGYPVVLNFAKEPNPGVFERVRDILLATSYTKKTS